MDISDEDQPLFQKNALIAPSDQDGSDSEDDFGLSSIADHDQYDNLNIPSHMKDILRMGNHDIGPSNLQDDSDSDNDSLYRIRPAHTSVDINKLNVELAKNKFQNFPLMPGQGEQEQETTTKKSKKPKEKKKRRDQGKKKADILEARQRARGNDLDSLMKRFKEEESGDEDKAKKTKQKGRKTRKQKSNEPKFDENGELLIRSTELLDESSSEEETEKKLSKKQELEMYRENERLRRAAKISLKPVYNVKSFDDLVRRRDEREEEHMKKMALAKQQTSAPPTAQVDNDDDEDSDIEIVGDPKKIAAALMSPERARIPVPNWSPVRHATTSLRNHNRSMLSRITNEGYAYRIKMEEQAKARGQYASATERARQLLQKEKDAMMIHAQVNQHFEKNKQNRDDGDDEEDEDYQEDEQDDGFMNEYSGSSEEEFAVEDIDDIKDAQKRKFDKDDDQEEDEDDMATMAFKRWKSKKIKKSIFDDEDDSGDEDEVIKKKVTTQKPVPKHSISNFFKAKEAEVIAKETEAQAEEKPLSRLVRRENKIISDEEPEDEAVADSIDDDAMDIDQPLPVRKLPKPQPLGPKEKNEYLEEEAEEEEDEFFGAGGSDGEHGENLDEYEKDDLLVEENNEHIDEAVLREAFNKQDRESDSNMIQRLMTDITGGGLRKQKAAAEAGLMLDDIDLFDDEDNDLVAIRRAAAARRRRLLKKKGGDILDNLMSDPKTAAFAKAAQAIPDEAPIVFLSDSEVEDGDEEEEEKETTSRIHTKLVIQEEDDEDEEQEEDDLMEEASDEDNILVVDEFDTMTSPMRGGLASNMNITSAVDEDEGFQVETMISPMNARRAKPIFSSPNNMERFKRLLAETSNALNGTSDSGGPRVGFGALPRKADGPNEEKEKPKTFGSIGELFNKNNSKQDGPPKVSKLKKLSKTKDVFQYGL